jgi:cyanophycin synthetase
MNDDLDNLNLKVLATYAGAAYGVLQSTLVACINIPSLPLDVYPTFAWETVDAAVDKLIYGYKRASGAISPGPFHIELSQRLIKLTITVLTDAGLEIFSPGRIISTKDEVNTHLVTLALPAMEGNFEVTSKCLIWSMRTIWQLIVNKGVSSIEKCVLERAEHQRQVIFDSVKSLRPAGTNTLHLLRGSYRNEIPWRNVSPQHYQFGWGINQAHSQSTVFDTTPGISVAIARDKQACSRILREAGMPTPVHMKVRSYVDALKSAHQIGYPVVVKPSNLDGGIGVFAGLENDDQLKLAWEETTKHSKSILVEKHCSGEDYRLIVIDGELKWAVLRQPAGVLGNGANTISELVALANRDPRRGHHALATLRPIVLEQEALDLLTEANLSPTMIPKSGNFVRLRRASNVSSGGMPVDVTSRVHPDNRKLAERAVALINLDIAGVDLIIPDISRSWLETGAAIIEINAKPQLVAASQDHLYSELLKKRVRDGGRIPIFVVLTDDAAAVAAKLNKILSKNNMTSIAVGSPSGLYINGVMIGHSQSSAFANGRALLMHPDISGLALVTDWKNLTKTGLPFDKFDFLIADSRNTNGAQAESSIHNAALNLLSPHCSGKIKVNANIRKTLNASYCARFSDKITDLNPEWYSDLISSMTKKTQPVGKK